MIWAYVLMLLPITLFCIALLFLTFGEKMFKPKFNMTFDEATELFDLVKLERDKLWESFPTKCGDEAVKMDKRIKTFTSLMGRLMEFRGRAI